MKNHFKLLALLVFSLVALAFACTKSDDPDKILNSPDFQTFKAVGVVRSIDLDAGKLTIDHEDIPGYMSAMQMNEAVKDPKMLETVKAGDKIEFEFEKRNTGVLITKVTKIGEVTIINGGELYKMNCATCHGGLGEGATRGISLVTGHALGHTEKEYSAQVMNGEGKKMPAFKDKLSTEQIAAVVKFVREELQKDISDEDRAKHKH